MDIPPNIYPIIDLTKGEQVTLFNGQTKFLKWWWVIKIDGQEIGKMEFKRRWAGIIKQIKDTIPKEQFVGKKKVEVFAKTGCIVGSFDIVWKDGDYDLVYNNGRWTVGAIARFY